MNTIIFDIDGTLANIEHRRKYLEHVPNPIKGQPALKKRNWMKFSEECVNDTPNFPVARLCHALYSRDYRIWIFSGRSDLYLEETKEWLNRYGILYHELRMRKHGDFRKDSIIKDEMLSEEEQKEVLFIVDDRDQVVKMWRDRGITVLQCAYGDF